MKENEAENSKYFLIMLQVSFQSNFQTANTP